MSGNLRREVLRSFKKLHRTRLSTFQGDTYALDFTRQKINNEFRKNINVKEESAISELIKFADEVEHEIRTTVVQAVEKRPGVFELRITDDTVRVSNDVIPELCQTRTKATRCSTNKSAKNED